MSGTGYAARYLAAVAERGRLCAGVDPHPALLEQWGLPVSADGVARFGQICVDAFGPTASVIKPQVAFFEAFGSPGMAALESVIVGCRAAGALVIADAKRGDIGSTMAAYTRAWLADASPLCSDAVTASPYLGFGSLAPTLDQAHTTDRGVYVLARTSNPEGADLQRAMRADGATVAQGIVEAAADHNADGRATVGLVVGATRAHGLDLSRLQGSILAPGLGAQGATPADLPEVFDGADPRWVLPASSRGLLAKGPDVEELRSAYQRTRDEVEAALG